MNKKKTIFISLIFIIIGFLSLLIIGEYLKAGIEANFVSLNEISIFKFARMKGIDYILLLYSPFVLILIGTIYFLFNYLETGFLKVSNIEIENSDNKVLDNKVEEIITDLDSKYKDLLGKSIGVEDIDKVIGEKINKEITDDILIKFEEKYSKDYIKETKNVIIGNIINSLINNISNYINKLSRNATINLIIGVLTTIIAVTILGILVFENETNSTNSTDILVHYIPRISISIFIEIFSFFFLRLYRNNLNDVKYFQNERTNLLSKVLAIRSSQTREEGGISETIIAELMKTERNFILKAGESTIQLEKDKIDNKNVFDSINKVTELIDKIKK